MSAAPASAGASAPLALVRGPSALGGSPRRFAFLALTLSVTDFKLRFFGSVLGYFWQLMRPLLLFGVLYLVFTQFVRIGEAVAFYPVVLLTNIVLFTFFAEATGAAVGSVVDRESLVRKIAFPRMAIPVAVVLTAAFNLALNALVVLSFALLSGVRPRWTWLELPLLLLALAALSLGLAMLLSALYVRYRDVRPIWDVTSQLAFYGTPILWTVETLDQPAWLERALLFNPLAAIFQQVRHAVIDPGAPSAAEALGGAAWLLVPAAIVLGVLLLGYRVFDREAPRIAEEL